MFRFLNFTFTGWLIRKQVAILFGLCVFLTRSTYALIKLVIRSVPAFDNLLPKGTVKWSPGESSPLQKPTLSEPQREAGCREVVLTFAGALGYISREVMSKTELAQSALRADFGHIKTGLRDQLAARLRYTCRV
jgi:hypothetical protein